MKCKIHIVATILLGIMLSRSVGAKPNVKTKPHQDTVAIEKLPPGLGPMKLKLSNTGELLNVPIIHRVITGKATKIHIKPQKKNPANRKGAKPKIMDRRNIKDWDLIFTEDFEGLFPGNYEVLIGDPTWDDESYRAYDGYWSGYCVGSTVQPPGPYPDYSDAWLIIGPFDIHNVDSVMVWYNEWLDVEENYDHLYTGFSVDGSNFYMIDFTGRIQYWEDVAIKAPVQADSVWVAFNFESDGSIHYEGAYIDCIWIETFTSPQQHPPTASRPSGPSSGNVGQNLSYSSTVTDPDGDQVYVQFDWGDGHTSSWIGPFPSGQSRSSSHNWSSPGSYCVKARGKDTHGNIGDWSSCKTVTINQQQPATDTISVVSAHSAPGSEATLPISLANGEAIGGVQFRLHFNSDTLTFDSVKLANRASFMNIGSNLLGDDTLIVMIYSTSGDTILPGSGVIVNVYFTVSSNTTFGDSTFIDLHDAILSGPSGQSIPVEEVDGWIYFTGQKGDINQDGQINVLDVVRAVNIALGRPPAPTPYELWAADMNNDGIVNVLDIVQLVNLILHSKNGKAANKVKAAIRLLNNKVILENDGEIAGIQLDLIGDISGVRLAKRASKMALYTSDIPGGKRVLIVGMAGETVGAGNGPIIEFDGSAEISHVLLSDKAGNEVKTHFLSSYESISLSIEPNMITQGYGRILFNIPMAMNVRIVLYDASGRLIKVLADAPFEAGKHEIKFDTEDFPRGVYFLQLNAGRIKAIRRFIIG